jgi:acylphosphatase
MEWNAMQEKISIRCIASGKVQGVWYRAATQDRARQLGVTGWARNLPDGRVEVIACGERANVLQLHVWMKQGPEKAEVTDVSYEEIAWQEHDRFGIK